MFSIKVNETKTMVFPWFCLGFNERALVLQWCCLGTNENATAPQGEPGTPRQSNATAGRQQTETGDVFHRAQRNTLQNYMCCIRPHTKRYKTICFAKGPTSNAESNTCFPQGTTPNATKLADSYSDSMKIPIRIRTKNCLFEALSTTIRKTYPEH